MRFDGRVCLVTGGGRGIGAAIARGLASEGARVAVSARSRDQCEEVAAEIAAAGGEAIALPFDVSDADAATEAVATVVDRLGSLDAVVNSAGISPVYQRAEAHDLQAFRQIIDVNLTGAFIVTRAAAPHLLASGGAVLNVASVLAVRGAKRLAGYSASKGGLLGLTRSLAREWADRGVRVNALGPGYVETEMTSGLRNSERLLQEILDITPMLRLATVDEMVGPALFLLSDEASYVTGTILLVDGGISA